jgi:DNA-binding LytR/AlgR family response regulator
MKSIRCLLVDDEDLALDILELYINRLDGFDIVGRCNNAYEAACFLQNNSVDLVFLDIQMPKLNGMEWIRNLANNRPHVIFSTAFERFALESYDVNAIDYLLKPFSYERFEKAAHKAQNMIQRDQLSSSEEEFINIRSERKLYKIAVNDILFIHSLSNYYKIVTTNKKIVAYGSLSSLENELPTSKFLRIHRSYLVAVNKIEAISGTSVILQHEKLPVGKKYRDKVENLYCCPHNL